MIRSFADRGTRDLFDGANTKAARSICPRAIWKVARRKLDQLNQAAALQDLAVPAANRLEKLRGERADQHSIRVNNQYRVCFRWTDEGAEDVEIVDYH